MTKKSRSYSFDFIQRQTCDFCDGFYRYTFVLHALNILFPFFFYTFLDPFFQPLLHAFARRQVSFQMHRYYV